MQRWFSEGRFANVTSVMALVVALGGTSYAAIALPRNSVGTAQLRANAVTSAKLRANAVTSAKIKNGTLLARDFKAGQLPAGERGAPGAGGPAGPAGPAGAPGPQGRPGTVRWALVNAAGTEIIAQSGAITIAGHPFAGETRLDFGQTTSGHAVWAVQSLINNTSDAGGAEAAPCGLGSDAYLNCASAAAANQVHVVTKNLAGSPANRAFYVYFLP